MEGLEIAQVGQLTELYNIAGVGYNSQLLLGPAPDRVYELRVHLKKS
jgi:hypothetical protein